MSSRGPAGGQPRASPRIRGSPGPPTSNRSPEPPLGSPGRLPPRMNRHAPPQARRRAEQARPHRRLAQRRKSLVAVAQGDGEACAVAPLLEALRSPLRLGQELELALPLGPLREVREVEPCPVLDALVTSRCRHTHRGLERRERTPGLARPVERKGVLVQRLRALMRRPWQDRRRSLQRPADSMLGVVQPGVLNENCTVQLP